MVAIQNFNKEKLINLERKHFYDSYGNILLTKYLIDKDNFGVNYNLYSELPQYSILSSDSDKSTFTSAHPNFLTEYNELNAGKGTWKYIDPLEKAHPTEINIFNGLPSKPLTTICYNRFIIALLDLK